jgi:glucosylceramidase
LVKKLKNLCKSIQVLIRIIFFKIKESARIECAGKLYPNTESISCVCNSTYCDNFPALQIPESGSALVFETSKKGDRFKESELKFDKTEKNSTNSAKKQSISIDINTKFQNILGFGGAFTDSTGFNIKSLPESLGNNIINDYFSQNGIEYSMARTPMAGSDMSIRNYTYDDVTDDKNLTHFALQKEDLEYKVRIFLTLTTLKFFILNTIIDSIHEISSKC